MSFSFRKEHGRVLAAVLMVFVFCATATAQADTRLKYRVASSWGSEGSGNSQFEYPEGIEADRFGNVYVADSQNYRILKFNRVGKQIDSWSIVQTNEDLLAKWPLDVAVDALGSVYVAIDTGGIMRFSPSGELLGQWGDYNGTLNNRLPGQLMDPAGIAVDSVGNVYVSDSSLQAVLIYSNDGEYIDTWKTETDGRAAPSGRFEPVGIAADDSGHVFLANGLGATLLKFTTSGSFIKGWGELRIESGHLKPGQFRFMAEDVATGPNSAVYATDKYEGRIHRFTATGKPVTQWLTPRLGEPNAEAVTAGPKGDVYVLTRERVYRYRVKSQPPRRPEILKAPRKRSRSAVARFKFRVRGSDSAKARFRCRISGRGVPGKLRKWRNCSSPVVYRGLNRGPKKFQVKAVAGGLAGRQSVYRWRVIR